MLINSRGLRDHLYCTYISTQLYILLSDSGLGFSFEMMPSGVMNRHDTNLLFSFSLPSQSGNT